MEAAEEMKKERDHHAENLVARATRKVKQELMKLHRE